MYEKIQIYLNRREEISNATPNFLMDKPGWEFWIDVKIYYDKWSTRSEFGARRIAGAIA